jgi:tetratricopeptide (TPR) repeat protein
MNKFAYAEIKSMRKHAGQLIDEGYFEEAVSILIRYLSLDHDLEEQGQTFCELGFCFLSMGWHEDAVGLLSQYLETAPSDNDARFYLASGYASLGWINESMEELKRILASDPTDVLALHAFGLCYRDKGWLKESLELMKLAEKQAMIYGGEEEREIIERSILGLEKEIERGEEDKLKEGLFLIILLEIMKRKKKRLP